jgi:hypothetical protein
MARPTEPTDPINPLVLRTRAFFDRAHRSRERLGLPHNRPITPEMVQQALERLHSGKRAPAAPQPSAPSAGRIRRSILMPTMKDK